MATNTFTQLNKLEIAFKKLVGKAHTDPNKEFFNEGIASNVQLSTDTVFADPIPKLSNLIAINDTVNLDNYAILSASNETINGVEEPGRGVVEIVPFVLESTAQYDALGGDLSFDETTGAGTTIDKQTNQERLNSSNFHAFKLKLRSDYETDSANPRKGLGTFDNDKVVADTTGSLQLVPLTFGPQFAPIVRDSSGNQISATGGENFILDPFNGVLFVQDQGATFKTPTSVTASIYIGRYATELIASASETGTGGGNLQQTLTAGNSSSLQLILSSSDSADNLHHVSGGALLVSGGFVNFVQTRLSASLISGSDLELGNDLIVKGDATFGTAASDRVTIKGNLFIEGTATEISTTNLAVEDQFILLNSSSSPTTADAGIIIQTAFGSDFANPEGKGTALFFDNSRDIWSFTHSSSAANSIENSATHDVIIPTLEVATGVPAGNAGIEDAAGTPKFGKAEGGIDYKKGQLYIDESDEYGFYVYV